jgi:hypothetical protein
VTVRIGVNTALPRRASKEALKREAITPWFIDLHGLGVNTMFMSVSPERAMILWIMDDHEKFKWLFFIPAKNKKREISTCRRRTQR